MIECNWQSNILDKTLPCSSDSLTNTVNELASFIQLYGISEIDLSPFNINNSNPYHLAVCLRFTYSNKNIIAHWDESYNICKTISIESGIDWCDLLYGLDTV